MIIFDLAEKREQIAELERQAAAPDLWDDAQRAQELLKQLTHVKEEVLPWGALETRCAELVDLVELAREEQDASFGADIDAELIRIQEELRGMEMALLFSGPYDACDAILSINPGAGGTEAQDWAQMLSRMYLRWAENRGFTVAVVDHQPGEEAGLKSLVAMVNGTRAYGHLRAERGVHRLVRLSPFDASHRRHTSFAAVDVIPQIGEDVEVDLDPEDLKIDTYRASGAGGQHVNKTSSAVRITHVPTGIVVQCQNERSQHRNRDTALRILKARLFERQLESQQEELEKLRGPQSRIEWGSQIRSYVLHPYNLVKDHRTSHETSSVQAVMDGDLDPFIRAFLEQTSGGNGREA